MNRTASCAAISLSSFFKLCLEPKICIRPEICRQIVQVEQWQRLPKTGRPHGASQYRPALSAHMTAEKFGLLRTQRRKAHRTAAVLSDQQAALNCSEI